MLRAIAWNKLTVLACAMFVVPAVFSGAALAGDQPTQPTPYRTPTLTDLAYGSRRSAQPPAAGEDPAGKQAQTPGQLTAQQRLPRGGTAAPPDETLPAPKQLPQGQIPEHVVGAPRIEYHDEGKGPKEFVCDAAKLICQDYKNYYSCPNLLYLGGGVLVAAPLANLPVGTTSDEHIQNWYQDHVRNTSSDDFAKVVKPFGAFQYAIPVYLAATGIGKLTEDHAAGCAVFDWGQRSLRALIVGAPPVGILQIGLGAGRPSYSSSKWRPLSEDHAVSGHAFVGAIPFLTAALMTDNRFLQFGLGAVSLLPGWSRLNDDDHYFSQVMLGWWMAYLAVRTVDRTEEQRNVSLMPVAPTGEPGVGVLVQY